jgi:hypothetical protein
MATKELEAGVIVSFRRIQYLATQGFDAGILCVIRLEAAAKFGGGEFHSSNPFGLVALGNTLRLLPMKYCCSKR